jgi:hypothetical protein
MEKFEQKVINLEEIQKILNRNDDFSYMYYRNLYNHISEKFIDTLDLDMLKCMMTYLKKQTKKNGNIELGNLVRIVCYKYNLRYETMVFLFEYMDDRDVDSVLRGNTPIIETLQLFQHKLMCTHGSTLGSHRYITLDVIKYCISLNIKDEFMSTVFDALLCNPNATYEMFECIIMSYNIPSYNIISTMIRKRVWNEKIFYLLLQKDKTNLHRCFYSSFNIPIKIIKTIMINGIGIGITIELNGYYYQYDDFSLSQLFMLIQNGDKINHINDFIKKIDCKFDNDYNYRDRYNVRKYKKALDDILIKNRNHRIIILLQLIRYTIAGPIILDEMLNEIFI